MLSQQQEETHRKAALLFYSDQSAGSIARDLKTSAMSLRKWWVSTFGKEEVRQRGKTMMLISNKRRGLPEGQVRLCKCGEVCRVGHYECTACNTKASKQYLHSLSYEDRELYLARCRGHRGRYRELYPERFLAYKARERARRYGIPFTITKEYIKSCIPLDGCCPITLQAFELGEGKVDPKSMTLDRIIPELGYVVGNVSVVSHLANTIKQNCTDPLIFRRVADYVESGKLPPSTTQKMGSAHLYTGHPERIMTKGARVRAKKHGVPCEITAKYIRSCFPEDGCCPITRQLFRHGKGKCGPQSMSLDRIVPELGYVPGNITVISHLANTIKQNCTDPEVFRRIALYLESAQTLKKVG